MSVMERGAEVTGQMTGYSEGKLTAVVSTEKDGGKEIPVCLKWVKSSGSEQQK